ncbi:MAG: hypothetical protein II077_07175 [Treponema sp.]|nr:hypothetical protein [Treponema sp.]
MKKIISALLVTTFVMAAAFADKSLFYENGKVLDTMYVNSEDGLKVRDLPSLKSNRICGLAHRLPVKVVAVGKEETIDGITAPWIEILVPRYEWKGGNPEYGWVFGGYLSKFQASFVKPKNAAQLEQYLKCGNWMLPDESTYSGPGYKEGYYYNFFTEYHYTYSKTKNFLDSDRSWFFQNYDDDDNQTSWKALNSHQIQVHWYIPESTNGHVEQMDKKEILEIDPIDESQCYINGKKYLNKPFENRRHWYYEDVVKMPLIYKSAYSDNNSKVEIINGVSKALLHYSQETQGLWELRNRMITSLIKHGVSAKGSDYEKEYRDYWDPIMEEHQKKADEGF